MSTGRTGTTIFTFLFLSTLWVFAVWLASVRWGDHGAAIIGASALAGLIGIWGYNHYWRKPPRR